MAEIDDRAAEALCRALEPKLTDELGQVVHCTSVAMDGRRWDIEAHDHAGKLVRLISYTATVPQEQANASDHLRDVRIAADRALAQKGLKGFGVSFHARRLPRSRASRQAIGVLLADRVERQLLTGQPVLEDWIQALRAGRHPLRDSLASALSRVELIPVRPDTPAKIAIYGHDQFTHRVPALHEELLPAIATKQVRHAELTPDLTLVVECVLAAFSRSAVEEAYSRLSDEHTGFRSVYVATFTDGEFGLLRLY